MAIYTKTGDQGETSLFSKDIRKPVRIPKNSKRIRAIGAIDELNSFLGMVRAKTKDKKTQNLLKEIQKNLFVTGSILAGSSLRFSRTKTKKLEKQIDIWEGTLPPIKNFILPGGGNLGSLLHYARTVARRAEREVVALSQVEKIKPEILRYLNRLSDFLFVMARKVNFDEGGKEEVWVGRKR